MTGMVASRLARFGSTVFSEITALARRHGAVDLSQGYPSWEGPDFVKRAAVEAIEARSNQYPPSHGIPELREAVAARWFADTGMSIDPDRHVTITSGCTEAIAASFLGLLEPGDEVILFEPTYDAYPVGVIAFGGGTPDSSRCEPPTTGSTPGSWPEPSPIGPGWCSSTRHTTRRVGSSPSRRWSRSPACASNTT